MEMCVYIYISISNTDSSMEYFGEKFCTLHRWNFKYIYIYIYMKSRMCSFHRWNFSFVISDVSTDGNWLFNLMHVYAVSIIARLQRPLIFFCTLLVL